MFWKSKKLISYVRFYEENVFSEMEGFINLIFNMWNNIASNEYVAIEELKLDIKDEKLWYASYALIIPILAKGWQGNPLSQSIGHMMFDRVLEHTFIKADIGRFSSDIGKFWIQESYVEDIVDGIVRRLIRRKIDKKKYEYDPSPVFNSITLKLHEEYQEAGKRILKKMKKYEFDITCNHPEDVKFLKILESI